MHSAHQQYAEDEAADHATMVKPWPVITVVIETHKVGIKKIYLADKPAVISYYLDGEARTAAICLALEHVSRRVARFELDAGTSGPFDLRVNIESKP